MNTFRGNKAVQNANEALRNSDAAMAIINSAGTDYNKLDQQQYNTLTNKIGKIATGGAATEGSTSDLRAQTLMSRASSFWQSVSGKPTGAQLGDFIKQNKEYLESLNTINHKYVDDYRQGIENGYKRRLNPDDLAEGHAKYFDRSSVPTAAAAPSHTATISAELANRANKQQPQQSQQPAQAPIVPYGMNASDYPKPQPTQGYAFGGAVQPPGFQHVYQQRPPRMPVMKAPHMPKAPVDHVPVGDQPMTAPLHFEQGGTVPGQPQVPYNSPANDTVKANLTPKEEVLPLSVTQSRTPALSAYLHMKARGYK